jgi:hypothetical protein
MFSARLRAAGFDQDGGFGLQEGFEPWGFRHAEGFGH